MVIEHVFQVGDRVQLFGGSPVMHVEEIDGNMVVCYLRSTKHGDQFHRFYADQLQKVQPE
jgi:uncharacterized protein YodC (DUF2158 family)